MPRAVSEGAIDAINDTLKAAALLGLPLCGGRDDGSDDQVVMVMRMLIPFFQSLCIGGRRHTLRKTRVAGE